MYQTSQILQKLRELKPILLQKYPIRSIGLFGSYARNEANQNSDIDILIDFQGTIGWEIMDIVEDLDNLFGQEIDLVTRNSIKGTLIEKHINQDIIYA